MRAAAGGRDTLIVAENEPQQTQLVRPDRATAATASTRCGTTTSTTAPMVALTGRNEAYYTDYLGDAAGVHLGGQVGATCIQGQRYAWQKKRRGTPALDLPPAQFVTFLAEPRSGRQLGRGLRVPCS